MLLILYPQASMAKLETSVSVVNDKLELKVYGFNDKLPTLLSKLLLIAKSFLPANDRFKVITCFGHYLACIYCMLHICVCVYIFFWLLVLHSHFEKEAATCTCPSLIP